MRRWLYDWAAPLLVVVLGLTWLVWRAHVPVAPSGPKLRTDKTHQVVIPTAQLLEHPVWLRVEMAMDPPIMAGSQVFARGLRYEACVRSVEDIARIQRRALTWAGEPRARVQRLVWSPITLSECLRRPWTSGALP